MFKTKMYSDKFLELDSRVQLGFTALELTIFVNNLVFQFLSPQSQTHANFHHSEFFLPLQPEDARLWCDKLILHTTADFFFLLMLFTK